VYRVLSCLTTQHDYRLVAVAGFVCAASALAAIKIYSLAPSQGRQRWVLLLLAGICGGCGIWATHFIAMLAYEAGFSISYQVFATTASLISAVATTTVGFAVACGGSRRHPAVGGAVVGAGIGLMHYSGMQALIIPGTLNWDAVPVVASLAIGAALAAGSLTSFYRLSGWWALWMSAGLLTLAICGLHFTGMSAVNILPDPTIPLQENSINDGVMALAVASVALLVVVSCMASVALIESQTRRLREEELSLQNARFDLALRNLSEGLCMFDAEKRLVVCNDRYATMYRLPPELLEVGTPHDAIIAHRVLNGILKGEKSQSAVAQKISALAQTSTEVRSSRIDGLANGCLVRVTRQPMQGGGWVAIHEDVTERQDLNARLEQNNKLLSERTSHLQAIVDNFPGGIGFFDRDLRLLVCNDRAKRLLDLPDWLFANGPVTLEDLIRFNASRGEFGPGDVEEQVAARMALAKGREPYEFQRQRQNGTVLDVRGMPLDDGGFVTTYMDITERHRSEAKIAHMARHDALTGLPNRVQLNERMEQALARCKRGERLAIHLLDLDHFKSVNDTLGHPVGDKLLKVVSDRLRMLVRETDTIARMGGDEFAIIQSAIEQPTDAAYLAARIIESIGKPYDIDGHQCIIGISAGIAIGPTDGDQADTLVRNADLALYNVKGSKRGTFRFFERRMDAEMQARRSMENDLRKALPAGELELYYQPIVDLKSHEIGGFEALVRWRHPERGLIPPGEFIPLAEERGFIVPLGEWTIRQACATAAGWPNHLRVAVNISPAHFKDPRLIQVVVGALASSGLPAERLELEITETALLEDNETTIAMLHQLRMLGVRIVMDDFGIGYSSLSYLQSFPFDTIKIDRAFVSGATDPAKAAKLVRAIAALANDLGMATTAEGVETEQQLESLRAEGCSQAQGYYFSNPLPAHEVQQLLVSVHKDRKPLDADAKDGEKVPHAEAVDDLWREWLHGRADRARSGQPRPRSGVGRANGGHGGAAGY